MFVFKPFSKSDIDACMGVFFDGFAKIFAAVGMMLFAFDMPHEIVIGRMLPGIGLSTLFGTLWYFYEAYRLAKKEKRNDVTAQPFGVGGPMVMSWLFLIIGPVYQQTNDAILAYQVGLAACFIGGIVEISGAFIGKWLLKNIPTSALLGNLASSAFVWLALAGFPIVFNNFSVAVIPLGIVLMDYLFKSKRRIRFLSQGLLAITVGTIIAWTTKEMHFKSFIDSLDYVSFYYPHFAVDDVFLGMKHILNYLPIIIPIQIANFLNTLQSIKSAEVAGDVYPEKQSMLADGISTVIGSLFGNPFPTTVYFGHPTWKSIGARSGYSLMVGVLYIIVTFSGLTFVMMNIIPYEVTVCLLIFVGSSVFLSSIKSVHSKYFGVFLITLIPIAMEYIKTLINNILLTAGSSIDSIPTEIFNENNIPMEGISILGSGGFLSSLLLGTWIAFVIENRYGKSAIALLLLSFSSLIGLIHSSSMFEFNTINIGLSIVYLIIAFITYQKKFIKAY